mmetsp:Transcript_25473/g.25253  ORF Transcript_25473/g.25253 Transcript_25473/m.25253 type:complete len:80 (-) Transcript_25473:896-1135(-)
MVPEVIVADNRIKSPASPLKKRMIFSQRSRMRTSKACRANSNICLSKILSDGDSEPHQQIEKKGSGKQISTEEKHIKTI